MVSRPPFRSSGRFGSARARCASSRIGILQVGAGDLVDAARKLDVAGRDLEELRRDAPALLDRAVAGDRGRAARHHQRARRDRGRAVRHLVAVAFDQLHVADVDAELLRHDARQASRDALAPSPARRAGSPPCRPRSAGPPSRSGCRPRLRGSSTSRCRAACRSARDAARRLAKPFQSASASALSIAASNSPLS